MKLKSKYIREQQLYTEKELCDILELSESEFDNCLNDLFKADIVRAITPATKDEYEVFCGEGAADALSDIGYVFRFVGLLLSQKRVIKVFPKCYSNSHIDSEGKSSFLDEKMKTILKVIKKYNSTKGFKYNQQNSDKTNQRNNYLGLMVYFLADYYENGLYTNVEEIIEENGQGPILWTKTIDEITPIIQNDKPYYLNYFTYKNTDDEYDYFRELHAYIVNECSRQISEADLNDILGFDEIFISNNDIKEFGSVSYILQRIRQEQTVQFETRKLQLLNAMYSFIDEDNDSKMHNQDERFQLFGIKRFENVWEDMVRKAFSDRLHSKLKSLPISLLPKDNGEAELIDLICKPTWEGDGVVKQSSKTLRPDTISIENNSGKILFAILDAKYYVLQLQPGQNLKGNPGVEDVSKQHLYQMAYMKFANTHGINNVRNCFLMPIEGDDMRIAGNVTMDIFSSLETVRVRLLPFDKMMKIYLSKNDSLPLSYLQLDIEYKAGVKVKI